MTLALMLLTGLSLAGDPAVRLPEFKRQTLDNGLRVLLLEQREVPIVNVQVLIRSGSDRDPAGKEGLASLTADLLRKGSTSRTADQISTGLDFIGATLSASAGHDFTTVSMEFLKKDTAEAMDLLADMLLRPSFPALEVTKLARQRIDEIKSIKDRPGRVIGRYFESYLFGDHTYGRATDGSETSLALLTRRDVAGFHRRHYTPPNAIVAVAGDFDGAAMETTLSKLFGAWKGKAPESDTPPAPAEPAERRLLVVDKPDSTQTFFQVGALGVPRTSPDRVFISVINTLFGGRFTSRLNSALRINSGLTYGANSVFDQRLAGGSFWISSYTRNAATEEALDKTLAVLDELHRDGITEEELRSTKTYLKGQFPTSIETTDRLASTIARLEFYGLDVSDVDGYFAKIDSMTMADARRIIGQYFPRDKLTFVLIGKLELLHDLARKYAPRIDVKKITQPGY